MPTNTLPDLPAEITTTQILAWCDALKIDRGEAAAMLGKAKNFWSRLSAGDADLKVSEFNMLLKNFHIRKSALERQS